MALLRVAGLTKRFGGVRAVDDCSFDVDAGTAVGLIGPNGSGKTTIFNLIASLLRPDAGQIFFDGARIDGLPPWEIARRGIGRTFQSIRLFRDLPVWENLAIAAMGRKRERWEADGRDWLTRLGLSHLAEDPAGTLSVGQQRLLELAMTLLVAPPFVMELCDKIVVLDHGEKIAEGPPDAIRRDERVIGALLGQRRAETLA
jgi:ABC-type branched-subunit amino acid transport system ATPase component